MSDKENQNSKTSWVWISGIAFLLCLFGAVFLIFFGKRLQDLGIVGNIYYIILIPLGFSAAAFLAGAMKSYASFKSGTSMPYGQLNLTGPIVIFALVVGGGFIMPNLNKKEKFDFKVRIVNKSTNDLLNAGSAYLYIGKYTRKEDIHNGEVLFPDIPELYQNKKGKIALANDNNQYQLAGSGDVTVSNNEDSVANIFIERTKASIITHIRGSITNAQGFIVKNALLDFGSGLDTCFTNENGDFNTDISLPEGSKVMLEVLIDGEKKIKQTVTVSSSIPINLKIE